MSFKSNDKKVGEEEAMALVPHKLLLSFIIGEFYSPSLDPTQIPPDVLYFLCPLSCPIRNRMMNKFGQILQSFSHIF